MHNIRNHFLRQNSGKNTSGGIYLRCDVSPFRIATICDGVQEMAKKRLK